MHLSHKQGHEKFQPIITIERILHEPARFAIMALLYKVREANFSFLKSYIGLTQGNLSSHIRRLEKAGYIRVEKEFMERQPNTIIYLIDLGQNAYTRYRKNIEQFLRDFDKREPLTGC